MRLIVPFPAGTAPDILARMYSEQLGRALGQPFYVENRPGASGNLGAEAVAKATPDGYTLLYAFNQIPTMNPHLFSKLAYDPLKDLAPISQTLTTAYVILANKDFPADDLAGIARYAKAHPGELAYASYGPGTASHLGFELIQDRTGTRMLQVPYKQLPLSDVIGGQVSMFIEPLPSGIGFAQSGKVKAVAVTSPVRSSQLPNVPTLAESVPGLELVGWQGMWAPAGTPPEILNRLQVELAKANRTTEVMKRLRDFDATGTATTPAETAAIVEREHAYWGKLIKAKGIRLD
ncbi:tripartite tricarboxylate transporter substrate-binding protein [Variovorax sp. LjRoot290]|uniref:Bug family tripartite tricarboxylate transporter substrate binding protein n=1 Tax=Variovorax sp. LjRoot290 TaxID=3342316 RepID=UPI003ECED3A6